LKVAASITGAIWFVKSKGDALKNVVMTVDTKAERLLTDFPGQDKRSIFEPKCIVIEKVDGTLIESRDNPEESFKGQQRETPWDDIHVAHFCGEALGTYLNTPFFYTHEGFKTRSKAALFRPAFDGPLLSAAAYTPVSAADAIEKKHADAIAFGRLFIANPDLVERINGDVPLNPPDRSTFYGGGAHG
jgi:NADH:flavin oxidoreductase / NADH oxidase family